MRFMRIVFVLVILAAAGGLAFFYLSSVPDRRDKASFASNGADTGSPSAALGQFTPLDPPRPAPELGFAPRGGPPTRSAGSRGPPPPVRLPGTRCGPVPRRE